MQERLSERAGEPVPIPDQSGPLSQETRYGPAVKVQLAPPPAFCFTALGSIVHDSADEALEHRAGRALGWHARPRSRVA